MAALEWLKVNIQKSKSQLDNKELKNRHKKKE